MNPKNLLTSVFLLSGFLHWSLSWNVSFISDITLRVAKIVSIQETLWFFNKHHMVEHSSDVNKFMRYMSEGIAVQTVITNNTKFRVVGSSSKRNHMSIVLASGINDPIMQVYNKVLTRRHFYIGAIIFVQKITDLQPVYDMCYYINKHNFVNTLVYFQNAEGFDQIYWVSKFPKIQILNKTDGFLNFIVKHLQKVVSGTTNIKGYTYTTPLRQDPPHLFKYIDSHGLRHFEGSTYRIIDTFVDLLNGSFVDYSGANDTNETEIVNMKSVLNLVTQRKIEFSAHAYALFRSNDEIESSYPLIVVRWCLMVPLYNSISTYLYPLQPFTWEVWFFIISVFVALLALELFWICSTWKRYNRKKNLSLLLQDVILDNFCYMINISTAKPLMNPSILRFLLLATVLFHGFFLSANYTSVLGSILTVNLFHAQINTMEDIIKAALPVMIIDYELDFLRSEGNEFPQPFEDLIKPVDVTTFAEHQHKFNTSFAYFVTEDKWRFLDNQQKHLKQRIFKFSDICFGSYHLAYPMQTDSDLWRDLEYYTFRIHSSGLLNFYERNAFDYAVQAKLMVRMMENDQFNSAGMYHLAIAFIILLVFHTLAGIIFIIEILWTRIKFKIK